MTHIPDRFVPLVLTEIETGLRRGELIALRPRNVDFLRPITGQETIVEVPRKVSPSGERSMVKAVSQRRRTTDGRGETGAIGGAQPAHCPARPWSR